MAPAKVRDNENDKLSRMRIQKALGYMSITRLNVQLRRHKPLDSTDELNFPAFSKCFGTYK